MADVTYRIVKWHETFETSESRRYKNLTWVSLPIGFDSNGYQSLLDEFESDAPAIYGAWCALLSIAAKTPVRGVLANTKGAIPIGRIAKLTGFPAEVFERLFEWALREDVQWIEPVPVCHPTITQQSPNNQTVTVELPNGTLPDPTLHNITGRNGTHEPSVRPVRPLDVKKGWKILQPKAKQLAVDVSKTANQTDENFELSVKAVGFIEVQPLLADQFEGLVGQIRNDKSRGSPTIRNPWSYLRKGMIRICNEHNLDFDKQWAAIDIPDELYPSTRKVTK